MTTPLQHLWLEVFSRLMERDGYLVVGSRTGYKVGDRTREQYNLGTPFEVVGEATFADAVRQLDTIEEVAGFPLPVPPEDVRFYKARAVQA
jgi:hypothetical protein